VEVVVNILSGGTYQDKIQISLYYGNHLKLGGVASRASGPELRVILKNKKADTDIWLSLKRGGDPDEEGEEEEVLGPREERGEEEVLGEERGEEEVFREEQGEEEEVQTKPVKISYICAECGDIFKYLGNMTTHIKTAHGGENMSFKCPVQNCKYICLTKKNLDTHAKRKHTRKGVKCPDCDKSLPSEKSLKIHKAAHHVPTKCKVEGCDVVEPSRILAKKHLKNKHRLKPRAPEKAPPPCHLCGQPFKSKNGLRKHLKKHGGLNIVAPQEEVVVGGDGEQQAGAAGQV
jgi:hypothetical protein